MKNQPIFIGFNTIELDYLLSLANDSKASGVYWGRKDYYEKRQDKVIQKLENAIDMLKR